MSYDPVSISNMALAELPAQRIATLEESSHEAVQCRFWYRRSLDFLLEKHPWTWARNRVALAQTTNDRATEWAYAYARPAGASFIVAIFPAGSPPVGYLPWLNEAGQPLNRWPYVLGGDKIYSGARDAVMEFTDGENVEPRFSTLFAYALSLDLAARICMPITKSTARKKELMAAADLALQDAMAHDLNQTQPTYANNSPEADAAWVGPLTTEFQRWGVRR